MSDIKFEPINDRVDKRSDRLFSSSSGCVWYCAWGTSGSQIPDEMLEEVSRLTGIELMTRLDRNADRARQLLRELVN